MEQRWQRWTNLLRVPKKLLVSGVILLVLYTLFGFFIAPVLLKHFLVKGLSETLHRQVSIRKIALNPLALTWTMKGVSIKDREIPLFSLDQIYVNIQRPSLVPFGIIIEELKIERPYVGVVRREDGTLNCSDLMAGKAPNKEEKSSPPAFAIRNIKISGGMMEFLDEFKKVKHRLEEISVTVPLVSSFHNDARKRIEPDFRAVLNGAPVSFRGESRPFLESMQTALNIDIDNVDLSHYLPYIPFEMNCNLEPGRSSIRLQIFHAKDKTMVDHLLVSGDISLSGLKAREKNGDPLAELPRVDISLGRSDLMAGKLRLGRVAFESPDFHVKRGAEGNINLSCLMPVETGKPQAPGPDSPKDAFSIRVDELRTNEGSIHFTDNPGTGPFETALEKFNLALFNFTNERERKASLELSFQTPAQEAASLKGSFSLEPLLIEGEMSLKGIPLRRYAPYYQDKVLLNIEEGNIDLSGRFFILKGADGGAGDLKLSDLSFSLAGLSAKKKGEKETLISVPNLSLSETSIDIPGKKIAIGNLATEKGRLRIERSPKGALNLAQILPESGRKDGKAPSPQPQKNEADAGWSIAITKGVVDDYAIAVEDHGLAASPVKLAVNKISLMLEDFSNAKGSQGKISLDLDVPRRGKLALKGTMGINPILAGLTLNLKDLDIRPYEPYWNDKLKLLITDGRLSLSGNVAVQDTPRDGLKAHFKGDASMSSFAACDKVNGDAFLNWKSLYLGGMNLDYNPIRVGIDKVALTDFYSRLAIDEKGAVNIQDIVEKGEQTEAEPLPANQAAPSIGINRVTLQGGEIDFSDRYIRPNFSARLTEIGGSISDLSSVESRKADVRLSGKLNQYAPLEITGKINPLAKDIFVDLEVRFKDIDLGPMTPYAGKYIGYTIEKGKLSLELKYLVAERMLESQNRIFMDQFTLGGAVDSPQATKLPVALAISLLKNRKGEIELNLPVSGSLNDPKFSIGSVILKMVMNLLQKVFTAPFSIIGSLFGGGGEKLGHLEFPPGTSDVAPAGEGKLNKLIEIMNDRPGLKMAVEGHVDLRKDEDALREKFFMRKLRAQKLKNMLSKGEPGMPVDSIEILPDEYEKFLKMAYGKEEFPKPRGEWLGLKDLPAGEMEKLMRNHVKVTEDDLRHLANERAQKVIGYILKSGKVETNRVLLGEPSSLSPEKKDDVPDSRVNFKPQ